jgi:hypothetical protein
LHYGAYVLGITHVQLLLFPASFKYDPINHTLVNIVLPGKLALREQTRSISDFANFHPGKFRIAAAFTAGIGSMLLSILRVYLAACP